MTARFTLFAVGFLLLVACRSESPVSLAAVRSPKPSWVDSIIVTEGYFQPHPEEDLLTREKDRFSDLVELSFEPMMVDVAKGRRLQWRNDLGKKLGGSLVVVRGRLRVGPFGMLGRATVYVEVHSIERKPANKAPEPTPGAVTPRATEGASK